MQMSSGSHRLPFATAPTIIRANQKDVYFESAVIGKQLAEVIRLFKDASYVHRHSEIIKTLATLVYLSLTTASGSKTLGEEYVDLHYVSPSGSRLPSLLPRLGYVLTCCGGPRLLSKLFGSLAKRTSSSNSNNNNKGLLSYLEVRDLLNLHTALFYFTGRYYNFSKRLFGLRYALGYNVDPNMRQANGNYELLGLLIVLQLFIKYSSKLSALAPSEKDQATLESEKKVRGDMVLGVDESVEPLSVSIDLADPQQLPYIAEGSRDCMLCLSPMVDPSCASCGHMFCWSCILDWCKEREECPLCRATIKESELLPLR